MDASDIQACYGKNEDDPALKALFAKLGIKKRPKLVDFVGEIALKDRGLRLAMSPEGPKSSRLVLSAITFHSDAEKGYTPFAGTLPGGLTFDDTRADVHRKLGKPTDELDWCRLDHWAKGDTQLSVEYREKQDRIAKVDFAEKPEDD